MHHAAFLEASAAAVPELDAEWGIVAGAGRCLSDTRRNDHVVVVAVAEVGRSLPKR
jgi:hypothetical protein